ncbi:hypothetical protein ACSVIJ_03785 [Pseudomonas sp. NCHU5208]|uniref:hypothetical protein n=1 Tax=unclassified Pseudomonas TaxID=196821 RepID=UPI003F96941F
MTESCRRARRAGLLSTLLAFAVLALPLPTHAAGQFAPLRCMDVGSASFCISLQGAAQP